MRLRVSIAGPSLNQPKATSFLTYGGREVRQRTPRLMSPLAEVRQGRAVTPIGASTLDDSLRVLGTESGFPQLPVSEVRLHRLEGTANELVDCFADYVDRVLRFFT